MTRLLLAVPLLLVAAGCATNSVPYAPVRNVSYQAMGGSPMWLLTIGDDRIALRLRADDNRSEFSVPRVLPQTLNGMRSWQSGDIPRIEVEARQGPCSGPGGETFEDRVLVRLTTDVLEAGHIRTMTDERAGCGGRLLNGERS